MRVRPAADAAPASRRSLNGAPFFCHELRRYRNYVHPRREIQEAHTPDRDTLNVSWQVVSAVLNDLATTQPGSG